MTENKISFRMLINKRENKVLFAEAGKEFVYSLFQVLSLPVGTIIRLLESPNTLGSLGNLYKSLESLDEDYVLFNRKNDLLLKPDNVVIGVPLLLPDTSQCSVRKKCYHCHGFHCKHNYVTVNPRTECPDCELRMATGMTLIGTSSDMVGSTSEKGVVKGLVAYMVTDELTITPMSMISEIALLNKCKIKDFGDLEERMVEFGMDEALGILRASLQSKITLTEVFLVKQNRKPL